MSLVGLKYLYGQYIASKSQKQLYLLIECDDLVGVSSIRKLAIMRTYL